MLSKIKIILLSATLLIGAIFVGSLFYASNLLKPEEIRKIVLLELDKQFPGADVKMGTFNVSLGTSINLSLEKLDITLKKIKRNELLSVNDVKVKIPVWSILFGGGSIEIKLDSPVLSYNEYANANNWEKAISKKKNKIKKKANNNSIKTKVRPKTESNNSAEVPTFLAASKVNLVVNNTKISYHLRNKSKGQVIVSKFMIKNMGLSSNSAFEISSKLSFSLPDNKEIEVNGRLIGEFKLSEYLINKTLTSNMILNLNDIKYSGVSGKIPSFKTTIDLKLLPKGSLSGGFKLEFEERNFISSKFNLSSNKNILHDIKIELFLTDLLQINPIGNHNIKLNDSRVNVYGNLSILNNKIKPMLKFELRPGMFYEHESEKINITATGSYRGKKLDLKIKSDLLKGRVVTSINAVIDPNVKRFDLEKLPPYLVNMNIFDIELSKELLQKLLYPDKKKIVIKEKENNVKKKNIVRKKQVVNVVLPTGKINLIIKNLKIAKELLSAKGTFKTKENVFRTEKFNFNYSNGKGSLTHNTKFNEQSVMSNIKMNITDLNLQGFRAVLPNKFLKDITGVFTGNISGSINMIGEQLEHNIRTKMIALNGELKGIDISESINGVIKSIPILKDKMKKNKAYDINGNFDRFVLNGHFKHDHYLIQKFTFIGMNKKAEMKGMGNIYPLSKRKKGIIDFQLKDNTGKVTEVLKSQVGISLLPIRMTGLGMDLKPDYKYTINKIGKKAVQTQTKKAVKKHLNKLLKGKNENVNKLLKGLFK